jgi:hypothetical protein
VLRLGARRATLDNSETGLFIQVWNSMYTIIPVTLGKVAKACGMDTSGQVVPLTGEDPWNLFYSQHQHFQRKPHRSTCGEVVH